MPVFHYVKDVNLAGTKRVSTNYGRQTLTGQLKQRALFDELRAVLVDEAGTGLLQVLELMHVFK